METTNKYIQELLDRFFEGATTLDEERQLKDFFSKDQIPAEFQAYRSFFTGLKQMKNGQLSDSFEQDLFSKLDEKPASARIIHLRPMLLRIAAVVILALGIWFLVPKQGLNDPASDGIDWTAYELTEEESVEETLAALRRLSAALNSGKKKVTSEMGNVERVYHPIK